jgi:hypothetical protein
MMLTGHGIEWQGAPVMLSGLRGVQTWCNICGCMADHNTLYHQDIINLHREVKEDQ